MSMPVVMVSKARRPELYVFRDGCADCCKDIRAVFQLFRGIERSVRMGMNRQRKIKAREGAVFCCSLGLQESRQGVSSSSNEKISEDLVRKAGRYA